MSEDSIHYDSDGFEIPDEYWPLMTEKESLMCLSLVEYNKWINKTGAIAEQYKLECIKQHLLNGSMTPKSEPKGSTYNPETNSIEIKSGYTFDPKSCTIFKVRSNE